MSDIETLFDADGHRLYLTQDERQRFFDALKHAPRDHRTFGTILHGTGARISEALAVTPDRIDIPGKRIVFETLKKRRSGVFRAVPISDAVLDTIDMVHGLTELRSSQPARRKDEPLWPFSRTTAWRIIKRYMDDAGIDQGPHCSPKGLRHAFGIHAILSGVPVTTLKKWMGHSKLETTAIYLDAVGAEDREIAARMWN